MFCSLPGATGDVPCFSGAGDVWTEAEVRHKIRQKHVVFTRSFFRRVSSQAELELEAMSGAEN